MATFSPSVIAAELVAGAANTALVVTRSIERITLLNNNWAIVANYSINGKTKFREFYDMGSSGVQQIDYAVSCADQKLSLVDFKVLTSMSSKSEDSSNKNFADLSFYTPVIQHDINIVSKVCSDQMLTRSAKAND